MSGSQWLPGPPEDRRKRADWVPGNAFYAYSVRTPWLSMALAILLDVLALAAIVGGIVALTSGSVGVGLGLLLPGLLVLAPIGIWGTIVARRRFWSDR